MKAFAIGKRAKWKDYVDMYFLLKDYFSIDQISDNTRKIFKTAFNPKLFRESLAYFDDIDYREDIDYTEKSEGESHIKKFLVDVAISRIS